MKSTDARSLSAEAQQALRQRVILALQTQQLRPAQAARLFGLHRGTVSRWWHAFMRHGPMALLSRPRGRTPRPLLAAVQEAHLVEVVADHPPDTVDVPWTLWTRAAVAAWVKRTWGVCRSPWVGGRWLATRNYTSQKAARRAYERNPATVQSWLEVDYPALVQKAHAEKAEIHWLDEAGLRSDCSVGRGYAPRGQTPVQRIPGRRFGVNYMASVASSGLLRFMVYSGRLSGALFILFLSRLLANRPGKIYVIVDRHPTHRGRLATAWARQHAERLQLVYLPAYSPELNPVEYLNNDVKANAQRKGRARTAKELARKVRSYLNAIQYEFAYVQAYFQAEPVQYAA
jgi:transposase